MDKHLHLITRTTSDYAARDGSSITTVQSKPLNVSVEYATDSGLGYFFGFISAPDFNIPMLWFKDGTVFWDEVYGDMHLDLTKYHSAIKGDTYEANN